MVFQKRKKSILSFLARYSGLNINTDIKTGIFQNIETELKNLF